MPTLCPPNIVTKPLDISSVNAYIEFPHIHSKILLIVSLSIFTLSITISLEKVFKITGLLTLILISLISFNL